MSRSFAVVASPDETLAESTDADLLRGWCDDRDAATLTILMQRYGRLVFGVCSRQCRTREDAEDSFQATFLTLARDARRIRDPNRLASWLHTTAYRTACRTRSRHQDEADRLTHDPVDASQSLDRITTKQNLRALDEEVSRLPMQYREALVLVFLEGFSYDEAAERLGTSEPALRGRLQRGKQKLRSRLIRRGVSLSIVAGLVSATQGNVACAAELLEQATSLIPTTPSGPLGPSSITSLIRPEPTLMQSPLFVTSVATGLLAISAVAYAQFGGGGFGGAGGPAEPRKPIVIRAPQAEDVRPAAKVRMPSGVGMGEEMGGMDMMSGMGGMAMGAAQPAKPRTKPVSSTWVGGGTARIADIEGALEKKLAGPVEFRATSLSDVVELLSEMQRVPITIKARAIEEVGIDSSAPVTVNVSDVTFEAALNLVLKQLDLTYTIEDEVLQITTQEDADKNMLIRVYWLGKTGLSAEGAAELVQRLVTPDAWEEVGGPGSIAPMQGADGKSAGLAIRATYLTHRQISSLLAAVGQFAGEVKTPKANGAGTSSYPGMGPAGMGGYGAMDDMGYDDEAAKPSKQQGSASEEAKDETKKKRRGKKRNRNAATTGGAGSF